MSLRSAVVLAAGEGKRMRSPLPKVLHRCAEVPLIGHSVDRALALGASPIVVVVGSNHRRVRDWLEARYPTASIQYAVQAEARGTADAVRVALDSYPNLEGEVLILYGDTPVLDSPSLERLVAARPTNGVAFLSAHVDDPTGLGRVVRAPSGHVLEIVEDRDATPLQRQITEINVGVYAVDAALLRTLLPRLARQNAQGEYYLTDIVSLAAPAVVAVAVEDPAEALGVNSMADLARAERALWSRAARAWMARGVRLLDPDSTWIGPMVDIGSGVTIGPNVRIYGHSTIGDHATLEGNSVVVDSHIGTSTELLSFCHCVGVKIGSACRVGPFARLRPDTVLHDEVRIGNFVEVKASELERGAKANHLAYLGDSTIGAEVNIGAGTITCNYDGGPVKRRTTIGAGTFVGSNATLVAPLRLGEGVFVAAGSAVTEDAPPDALVVGRTRQVTKVGYAARLRRRLHGRPPENAIGPDNGPADHAAGPTTEV